jgi:hypothetical protein
MNKPKKTIPLPIIVAILGLIGALEAAIISIIPSLTAKSSDNLLPSPLPTGLPSPTPMPTVVGTPITIGADIGATGAIGFTVKVYNVSLVVDEVLAYQTDSKGYTERAGYTNLLVKLRIANENPFVHISKYDIIVVDDYSNEYHTWGNWGSDFPEITSVGYNQSAAGALVYRIPLAALNNNLVLMLETTSYDTKPISMRMIISLGNVTSQP